MPDSIFGGVLTLCTDFVSPAPKHDGCANESIKQVPEAVLIDDGMRKACTCDFFGWCNKASDPWDGAAEKKTPKASASRASYAGGRCRNLFHGDGTLLRLDGSTYIGQFVLGKAHGHGEFHAANGSVYVGQWVQETPHGFGKCTFPNAGWYEGEWRQNARWGKGVELWPDGRSYRGEFVDNARDGTGTCTYASGVVLYEGQFAEDLFHGKGRFTYSDGRVYYGEWSKGQRSGYGIIQWPDGTYYAGNFKSDQRHYFGKMHWPDGSEYSGQWAHGEQDGNGVLSGVTGNNLVGVWCRGALHRVEGGSMMSGLRVALKKTVSSLFKFLPTGTKYVTNKGRCEESRKGMEILLDPHHFHRYQKMKYSDKHLLMAVEATERSSLAKVEAVHKCSI
eukprot:TRINITY_DN4268_c4_g1_i1.p1 TRINITY_DN4268_c4_g1~~TRINITY_DN4268_c4_g1_i1.p1  ORF type:complete len:391 (-),score=34.58 TRINITY_DN4268_c4_g1_i1:49-1221(-)